MNPEQIKDERYEELCALAAIGELSASEFAELNEHLSGCDHCRDLYADFRRISSQDIGAVAAGRRYETEDVGSVDEAALLRNLFARAQRETTVATSPPSVARREAPYSPLRTARVWSGPTLRMAGLAACFALVAMGAFTLGRRQSGGTEPRITTLTKAGAVQTLPQQPNLAAELQKLSSQRDSLQGALTGVRAEYAARLSEQQELQAEILAAREQLRSSREELQASKEKSQQSDAEIRDLQAKLRDSIARSESQTLALDEVRERLRKAEQEVLLAAASGIQDDDAKNLFGARDLHIVDVYDVDGHGKTRRAFGRVYYAERKLLLFYAFDLQGKQSARVAAGFQAWGYRQGDDDKPRNLGLFLMDDPAVSRWVLKVNDTRVLEHIDAVFVTLEPPNGSPSPSGRRLLYANLGGPPNHP